MPGRRMSKRIRSGFKSVAFAMPASPSIANSIKRFSWERRFTKSSPRNLSSSIMSTFLLCFSSAIISSIVLKKPCIAKRGCGQRTPLMPNIPDDRWRGRQHNYPELVSKGTLFDICPYRVILKKDKKQCTVGMKRNWHETIKHSSTILLFLAIVCGIVYGYAPEPKPFETGLKDFMLLSAWTFGIASIISSAYHFFTKNKNN